MADVTAQLESGLGSELGVLGGRSDSQRVGGAADDLRIGGALSVHHGEQGNLEVIGAVVDFAAVPGTVLIEGIIAVDEVGLHLVVAQGDAGRIKVTRVDHFLEGVDGGGDFRIIPGGLAGEDGVQGFVADVLLHDGLQVLGHAPGLGTGAAEGGDAGGHQVVAALDQLVIGLGNGVPAGLGQQVHVAEQGHDVHGQRHAVVLLDAVSIGIIGGVAQHDLGQFRGEGLISVVQAIHVAGLGEVAQEGAGPGEEDVRQGGRIRHGGLDLGLIGLILKSFPLDMDVGMSLFEGLDGSLISGAVGVGFRGDAPHGQGDFLLLGEGGAQGQQHRSREHQSKELLHEKYPPFSNKSLFPLTCFRSLWNAHPSPPHVIPHVPAGVFTGVPIRTGM